MAVAGYGVVTTVTAVERGVERGKFTVTATSGKEVLSVGAGVSEPGSTIHGFAIPAGGLTYDVIYSTKGVDVPAVADQVSITTWAVEATI